MPFSNVKKSALISTNDNRIQLIGGYWARGSGQYGFNVLELESVFSEWRKLEMDNGNINMDLQTAFLINEKEMSFLCGKSCPKI